MLLRLQDLPSIVAVVAAEVTMPSVLVVQVETVAVALEVEALLTQEPMEPQTQVEAVEELAVLELLLEQVGQVLLLLPTQIQLLPSLRLMRV